MTELTPKPEVIIFDSDKVYAQQFGKFCKDRDVLAKLVYGDYQSLKTCLESNFFPVAVVNICAFEELEDQLEYLRKLAHDTQLILISQTDKHEILQDLLSAPNPLADAALGHKEEFSLRELYGRCNEFISDWKQSKSNIRVIFEDDIDEVMKQFSRSWSGVIRSTAKISVDRIKTELKFVIAKLFSGTSDNVPIASEITVSTLRGSGKSSSYLFKLSPKIQLDGRIQKSAVLKFGPKAEVKTESHNYDKYVEWFLTIQQTVRKIGYEETANFGGILYSFPLDSDEGYISFAEFIRKHSFEVSCSVLENLFSPQNKHWLSIDGDSFPNDIPNDIQSYYIEHGIRADKPALKGHFEALMNELQKISVTRASNIVKIRQDMLTFPSIGLKTANPARWMWLPYANSINLSLAHGDLHANNILVDKDEKCFFIDFYYTGFGHIFRDFIDLELSVRYDTLCSKQLPDGHRLLSTDSQDISDKGLSELVALEKDLIRYHVSGKKLDPRARSHKSPQLRKCYELVAKIRDLAFENFPERQDQYYLALAYYSLKAIKYFYPLDVKLYRFIISGMYFELSGKPVVEEDTE